jgi:hypothetical protein
MGGSKVKLTYYTPWKVLGRDRRYSPSLFNLSIRRG